VPKAPEVVLATGLAPAFWVAQVPGHDRALVVLVKATFEFDVDGSVRLADDQEFPTGDVPYDDDEDGEAAPRYASDFEPFRPRADLLCVGHARPRQSATHCSVKFRVGGRSASLLVTGDRVWEGGMLGRRASKPQPFDALELRYERAYGGEGFLSNPVGRGHGKVDGERPLPNIEDPAQLVEGAGDHPPPAGFGPLARTWKLRQSKLGTYKKGWVETRWPYLPRDVDWSCFNAAPESLQIEGYLRGDEEVELTNLVEGAPACSFSLPGVRARVFVEPRGEPEGLSEVGLVLDTLWVDPDESRFVLVWRGHVPLPSGDPGDVGRIFFMDEPLDAPATTEDVRAAMANAGAAEQAELEPEAEEPPPEPVPESVPGPVPELDPELAEIEAEYARVKPQLDAMVAKAHDSLPPPVDFTPEQTAAAIAWLKEQGISTEGLGDSPIEEGVPDADSAPAEDGAPAGDAWTRERVVEAAAAGESMAGADLSELDLSGIDLSGVDLSGAILSGCGLRETVLERTRLVQAQLGGADLTAARMAGADLSWADCSGADMSGAVLDAANCEGALFGGARLADASLRGTEAPRADFSGADLARADCTDAGLEAAVLSEAILEEASFVGARMAGASIEAARALRADFTRADLTGLRASEGADLSGARLTGVQAEGSIWMDSNLSEAVLDHAGLVGALFHFARLDGADLSAADASGARFADASLKGARAINANLFEASFERADLTGADLTGANAYAAEFLDAVTKDLRLDGANLAGSKLADV